MKSAHFAKLLRLHHARATRRNWEHVSERLGVLTLLGLPRSEIKRVFILCEDEHLFVDHEYTGAWLAYGPNGYFNRHDDLSVSYHLQVGFASYLSDNRSCRYLVPAENVHVGHVPAWLLHGFYIHPQTLELTLDPLENTNG